MPSARLAVAGTLLALLSACAITAPRAPAPPAEPARPQFPAVEVTNDATVPIVVKFYRNNGGPFTLGDVSAQRTVRLVLPFDDIGYVFAETREGQRLDRRGSHRMVRIRRVTVEG
jgi:hypothetical protein